MEEREILVSQFEPMQQVRRDNSNNNSKSFPLSEEAPITWEICDGATSLRVILIAYALLTDSSSIFNVIKGQTDLGTCERSLLQVKAVDKLPKCTLQLQKNKK